jgi:hypothetical protein
MSAFRGDRFGELVSHLAPGHTDGDYGHLRWRVGRHPVDVVNFYSSLLRRLFGSHLSLEDNGESF